MLTDPRDRLLHMAFIKSPENLEWYVDLARFTGAMSRRSPIDSAEALEPVANGAIALCKRAQGLIPSAGQGGDVGDVEMLVRYCNAFANIFENCICPKFRAQMKGSDT